MTLERVVAAPFQQSGSRRLSEQEFVVALSLHRDWFSPAQAKRLVERALAEGFLEREGDELVAGLDPSQVTIPSGFIPDEDVLTSSSTFESILARLVAAGHEKREAVAAINQLQRDLGITIETAAALHATRVGVDVETEIARAMRALRPDTTGS